MASPTSTRPCTRPLGHRGEALVAEHLLAQGYTVLARNWRYHRLGELDLVALSPDRQTLVFIEVKTRRGSADDALETISPAKAARLVRLAEAYGVTHPEQAGRNQRIDLVGVALSSGQPPAIWHLENILDA